MSASTWSHGPLVAMFRVCGPSALGAAALLLALGTAPDLALAATQNVAIQGATTSNFAFAPSGVTVSAGDAVHWTNNSVAPHTVTRCDSTNCSVGAGSGTSPASYDSGALPGGSGVFDQVFASAGTYNYYCTFHGYAVMHGTVTVTAPVAVAPTAVPGQTQGAATAPGIPRAGAGPQAAGGSGGFRVAGLVVVIVLILIAGLVVLRRVWEDRITE